MPTKKSSLKKPSGSGRLSAEQMEQLPDRILDAALHLFNTRGFSETSMDQIAKAASASTKTIYARYANKADILRAVVDRIVQRTALPYDSAAHVVQFADDPPAYLTGLCSSIDVRISTEAAHLNRLAMVEGHRVTAFREIHAAAMAHGTGLIRTCLERWREQALLPNLTDSQAAAELCLSMATDWVRIATTLGAPPSKAEIEKRVAFAMDIFLRGLGYQPKSLSKEKRSTAATS